MSTRTRILARRRRLREAMTLVEIMIVVTIMALIAAAVGVAVIPRINEARRTQARTDAQSIRGAAERYFLSNSNAQCPTVANLIEAQEISTQTRTTDPWNKEFRIECRGNEIFVSSGGPDGEFGGEDDVE